MIRNRFLRTTALGSAAAFLVASASPYTAALLVAPTAFALALGGCATTSVTPQQVVTDVEAFASALSGILPGLDLPAAALAKVTYWVQFAEGVASQVETADATSAVTLINSLLQVSPGILAALTAVGIAIPSPLSAALTAFSVLVPTIEALLGMTPPASAEARAAAARMSPQEALQTLQGLARQPQ